jgi:hypothetical protein
VRTRVHLQEARAASGRHLSQARRSALPPPHPLDSGRDVHTASRAVASVAHEHGAEVTDLGTRGTRQGDRDHRLRPRQSNGQDLVVVYEAGPCGYGLSRSVSHTGEACGVVAPSLRPTKAGARGNTDRRDAVQRARLLRSGALTPVDVPQGEDDAMRDRRRAREDPMRALKAAKCRRHALRRRP